MSNIITINSATTWEDFTRAIAVSYPGSPLNLGEENYMQYFQQLSNISAFAGVSFPVGGLPWRELAVNILRQL